jgi:hypothetical protein
VEKIAAILVSAFVLAAIYGIGLIVSDDDNGSTQVQAVNTANVAATGTASGATPVTLADESQPHTHDANGNSIPLDGSATHSHAAVDDRGFSLLENGEQHAHTFTQAISPADRVELARQLALTREVALQYPTVADAERAGLHRAGPFSPGLGAHYINYGGALSNGDGVMSDDDIRKPLAYIYDGTKPDSHISGLFYMTAAKDPAGFAGPNDVWHVHHNICIKPGANGVIDSPLGADHDATKEQCDAVGGTLLKQTQLLLHVWTVPGYESPEGVFSHLSSTVTCADGTYNTIADVTKVGSRTTICKDNAE